MTVDEMIHHLETYPLIRKVTRFVSDKETIKVTRQHKRDKRDRIATYIVTKGRPNYAEREYIKSNKHLGPIGEHLFHAYPTKRK